MRDLALPLGVHNSELNSEIDFEKGMTDMWEAKEKWIKKKGWTVREGVIAKKEHFVDKVKAGTTKMSILDYRTEIILPATKLTQELHEKNKENFSKKKTEFLDMIVENLSPNIMLAYNIQELIPRTYWHDKKVKVINPLFKNILL